MEIRELLGGILDLVLPLLCAGCGASGGSWCVRCARGLGPPRVLGDVPGVPPTVAVGKYAGPLRAALLAYKEHGRRELVGPLAGLLAGAVFAAAPVFDPGEAGARRRWWLIPAPSRASAARARGGEHMCALTGQLAERLVAHRGWAGSGWAGSTVGVSAALRMRPGVRDSVGLDARARSANLRGRVGVRPDGLPPFGSTVLLVDDVLTTGATLRACTTALEAAGTTVRGALVLCDASPLPGRCRARPE